MHGELGPKSPILQRFKIFEFTERHEQKKPRSSHRKPMSLCPGACADCDDCGHAKKHEHNGPGPCARDPHGDCPSCRTLPETVFVEVECYRCHAVYEKSLAEMNGKPHVCSECKRNDSRKEQKHAWYERRKAALAKEQVC